jgi:glutamine---fructose-6-phosphate transaminase (isomerizing)
MCGIVGIISNVEVSPLLVDSIGRLEYRGYDSCGVATVGNVNGIEVRKDTGPVEEVVSRQALAHARGHIGIAHTRWATHGGVSRVNAHPHTSCDGAFAVVHNGIISNHSELRSSLEHQGHHFTSGTDTEVIVHLLEEIYQSGASLEQAFVQALRRLEGSFAVAMISSHDRRRLFCAREKSPLILGVGADMQFVASDINAFLPYTRDSILLEDGEYAVVTHDGYCVRSLKTEAVQSKHIIEVNWAAESQNRCGYADYMEKEICEQPDVISRAIETSQDEIVSVARMLTVSHTASLLGIGTTYYMALFGQYALAGLAQKMAPAISSDEAGHLALQGPEAFLLAISQSGETYDTLQSIRQAKAVGARTAAIVNVPGSSMTREVDILVRQNSGPEISVVSTKAAMAQMAILIRISAECAFQKLRGMSPANLELLKELAYLPKLIELTLRTQKDRLRDLALRYRDYHNWFFLGRGQFTPLALEVALKMKEVTYLHAEGMPAGFLKHGTLSLIDAHTPAVFLIPPRSERMLYELTMSSAEEVRARNGKVIAFCFDEPEVKFDEEIRLPKASPWIAPFLHLLAGQILAHEMAVVLGRNVDRPRSLAKSVTVA